MYAIIKASGKQYKVEPGQEFEIDRIQGEAGQAVDFSEVLLISKDENTTAASFWQGRSVDASGGTVVRRNGEDLWRRQFKQLHRVCVCDSV